MTSKQQQYKKSLIQKIQIVKSNVFSSDEERREFIVSRFGVDSTTKLSIDELKVLLEFCNRNVSDIPFSKPTEAQIKKIYETWYEKARDKSQGALNSFTLKIVKKDIASITKNEAIKLILALERLKA